MARQHQVVHFRSTAHTDLQISISRNSETTLIERISTALAGAHMCDLGDLWQPLDVEEDTPSGRCGSTSSQTIRACAAVQNHSHIVSHVNKKCLLFVGESRG